MFRIEFAAARTALVNAQKAYELALLHVTPMDRDVMHEMAKRNPIGYAKALRQMADIADTIPTLADTRKAAQDKVDELKPFACYRCDGTGLYAGPTNATRNGRPYCFYCNGTGGQKVGRMTFAEYMATAK